MGLEAVINGGLSFAAVLILMVLNVPIGIAMLVVGFIGFAVISGFDPAIFVLGTAPFDAVSKYTLSVLPLFVLMGNLANSSNLSRNLYDAAYAIVGPLQRWFSNVYCWGMRWIWNDLWIINCNSCNNVSNGRS